MRERGPLTGRVVSRYRVGERLGEGGMGVVYRARDLRLGRPVALKFLRPEAGGRSPLLERLRREARAASVLNHPHICTIHDMELVGDRAFLVMELLEGQTLAGRLEGGPLPLHQVLDIGLQLADALAAAHSKGVIHRDLKPGNIFVTGEGRVKVVDFGIARRHREASGLTTSVKGLQAALIDGVDGPVTAAGHVMGTLHYLSPEQARGHGVDPRTDLFSLGAVLYEMATGLPAFAGANAAEVLDAVLTHDPLPPSRLDGAVPAELDSVIMRALEKSPDRRYQSAEEVGAALEGVRENTNPRPIRSLAVLPLRSLVGLEGDRLADGLTDALVTCLSRDLAVRVVSLTSVMGYRRSTKPLPQITSELDVDAVVEGTVLLVGGRVRVTVRLVQGHSDRCLWSHVHDGIGSDALRLLDELSRAVAEHVPLAAAPPLCGSPLPGRATRPLQ